MEWAEESHEVTKYKEYSVLCHVDHLRWDVYLEGIILFLLESLQSILNMLCIKRIVLLQRRILDFDNCAFFSRIASVDMALKIDTRIVIVTARYRQ